jgi:hypothetical protein
MIPLRATGQALYAFPCLSHLSMKRANILMFRQRYPYRAKFPPFTLHRPCMCYFSLLIPLNHGIHHDVHLTLIKSMTRVKLPALAALFVFCLSCRPFRICLSQDTPNATGLVKSFTMQSLQTMLVPGFYTMHDAPLF